MVEFHTVHLPPVTPSSNTARATLTNTPQDRHSHIHIEGLEGVAMCGKNCPIPQIFMIRPTKPKGSEKTTYTYIHCINIKYEKTSETLSAVEVQPVIQCWIKTTMFEVK